MAVLTDVAAEVESVSFDPYKPAFYTANTSLVSASFNSNHPYSKTAHDTCGYSQS